MDATETQVIEAMQRIASHIKNPSKFSKASKLTLQLIQAGSVKEGNSSHFFTILEAAMSSPTACTDPPLRADYHALFSATQDVSDVRFCFMRFKTKFKKGPFLLLECGCCIVDALFLSFSFPPPFFF